MTKVKDKLTRDKALQEIFIVEDKIEDAIPKIVLLLESFPDTWVDSVNKNFASFLTYLEGITKKFNDEIKPNLE